MLLSRHIALALLPLALLTACEPRDPAPNADSLVIAIQADGSTLDPHRAADAGSMRLIENLYSTLMRYDEQYGEITTDLAASYDASDDGLTHTLTLRPDARFGVTGRPVTADDVTYSVERIIEHRVRDTHFAALDRIETPDDHTVVFRLAEPFAPFATYLAHPMNAIVDREVVEAHGGRLDNADAGSGPFRLVEWRKDHRMVIERDPHYYVEGLPRLERVTYRPIPDETARTTAIRIGEVHIVVDVPEKDVRILRDAPGVSVESVPGTFWEYIGLNTQREPLDDPRVRRAIAHAVDRHALNRLVKFEQSHVLTGGPIPPHHWAYAGLDLYPEPDPGRARELLAEAGYPDGFAMTMKVGSHSAYQMQAAEAVRQQLRTIGIDLRLLTLEPTVFFADLGESNFDMTLVGWVGFVDPDEWMYDLFHSEGRYNQQRYANDRIDELLAEGRRDVERDDRRDIYAQAQRIVADDAPMVFLYVNPQTFALSHRVRGWTVHPTATTIFLRNTHIEEPPQ